MLAGASIITAIRYQHLSPVLCPSTDPRPAVPLTLRPAVSPRSRVITTTGGGVGTAFLPVGETRKDVCLCVLPGPTRYFNQLAPILRFVLPSADVHNAAKPQCSLVRLCPTSASVCSCVLQCLSVLSSPLSIHIDHIRVTLFTPPPLSLSPGLNVVSMKTNVTLRTQCMTSIYQPQSICRHVTRTDPRSSGETGKGGGGGEKEKDTQWKETSIVSAQSSVQSNSKGK